jgi:hypothetical protein
MSATGGGVSVMTTAPSVILKRSASVRIPKTRATAEAGGRKPRPYKPLPIQSRHNGFDYRQIARERDAAIYEQIWNGCPNPSISYEVIRIRRREAFRIGARFIEAAEAYPNAEAWGTDGFTLPDRDAAFRKLRFLRDRQAVEK